MRAARIKFDYDAYPFRAVSSLAVLIETKERDRIPVSLTVPVDTSRPVVVAALARAGAIFCSTSTKKGGTNLNGSPVC